MLAHLRIKDLAIIEEAGIDFGPGLNIISGETGAGKTILINAIALLLGGRQDKDLIRPFQKEATVEALFYKKKPRGEDELLLKRNISKRGRGRSFLNGEMAPRSRINDIARDMVEIVGQHEHHHLLYPEHQTHLLDLYAGVDDKSEDADNGLKGIRELADRILRLRRCTKEEKEREELIRFQIEEIEGAAPLIGEDDELEMERKRLTNKEDLIRIMGRSEADLYSEEDSIYGRISGLLSDMGHLGDIDKEVEGIRKSLNSLKIEVNELARECRRYQDGLEFSPQRMREVEERLEVLWRLKKRYGGSIEEVIRFKKERMEELKRLTGDNDTPDRLEQDLRREISRFIEVFNELIKKRQAASRSLSQKVSQELRSLGMKRAFFEVRVNRDNEFIDGLKPLCDVNSTFLDEDLARLTAMFTSLGEYAKVEFLFNVNPGGELRSLSKVASGGELSRLMLALRGIITSMDLDRTFIFDEVDTGIGGAVAEMVGRRLKGLSRSQQVIVITHLPQIAALADAHIKVKKTLGTGKTNVEVMEINGEERIKELSRMLGGISPSKKVTDYARELLKKAGS